MSAVEKKWKQLFAKYYSENYRKVIMHLLEHGYYKRYSDIEGSNSRVNDAAKRMEREKLIVFGEENKKILNMKVEGIKLLIEHIKNNPDITPEHVKKAKHIKLKKGTLLDINIRAEELSKELSEK